MFRFDLTDLYGKFLYSTVQLNLASGFAKTIQYAGLHNSDYWLGYLNGISDYLDEPEIPMLIVFDVYKLHVIPVEEN